jgi:hypothetical protein
MPLLKKVLFIPRQTLKTLNGLSQLHGNVECKLTLQQATKVQRGNISCTKSDSENLIDKS